jgi:hypothetical protein
MELLCSSSTRCSPCTVSTRSPYHVQCMLLVGKWECPTCPIAKVSGGQRTRTPYQAVLQCISGWLSILTGNRSGLLWNHYGLQGCKVGQPQSQPGQLTQSEPGQLSRDSLLKVSLDSLVVSLDSECRISSEMKRKKLHDFSCMNNAYNIHVPQGPHASHRAPTGPQGPHASHRAPMQATGPLCKPQGPHASPQGHRAPMQATGPS